MTDVPTQVANWLKSTTRHSRHQAEVDVGDQTVTIEVGQQELGLSNLPEGWSVILTSNSNIANLTVTKDTTAPSNLDVAAWPGLKTLVLTSSAAGAATWEGQVGLQLVANADPFTFDPKMLAIADLTIRDGFVELNRNTSPLRLTIANGGISRPLSIPGRLTLESTVQLPDSFSAARTYLKGEGVTVTDVPVKPGRPARTRHPARLGAVEAPSGTALVVDRDLQLEQITEGSVIRTLGNSHFEVAGEAHGLRVSGAGTIRLVAGRGVKLLGEEGLTLELQEGDTVLGASGFVSSLTANDCVLTGSTKKPVAIGEILNAEGAELDHVDLSRIESLASVRALRAANRISPSTAADFESLADLAEGHPHGLSIPARQVYWAQLSDLVSDKRARGAVQSDLRFLAAHARWNAAPRPSRERAWMGLYRLVHYGESISRPLVWHLIMTTLVLGVAISSIVLVQPFSQPTSAFDYFVLWWDLLVSPLAFFRLAPPVLLEGNWLAGFLTLMIRVEGILMLFFSLAAIRRLTKAE